MFKMQAVAGPGPGPAPVECLPDELLALLFRLLDSKALLVAVPAVSAGAGGCAAMRGCRAGSARLGETFRWRAAGGERRAASGVDSCVQPLDLQGPL